MQDPREICAKLLPHTTSVENVALIRSVQEEARKDALEEAALMCEYGQNDCCYEVMDGPLRSRCGDAIRALATQSAPDKSNADGFMEKQFSDPDIKAVYERLAKK